MDIEPLDPRDSEWTVEHPTYRVFFWRPLEVPRPAGGATAYRSRAYRLVGAEDVDEVLRWAVEVAATEETFAVYVESTDAGGPGVLRLTGTDPTAWARADAARKACSRPAGRAARCRPRSSTMLRAPPVGLPAHRPKARGKLHDECSRRELFSSSTGTTSSAPFGHGESLTHPPGWTT